MAIDGKALRGSFDRATARSALHLVSAWAVSQKLSIGSVTVPEKSNDVTAIPELLKLIELSGAIVTIDAMGCQADIARAIVAGGGDYILALKGNQPTLHEGVVEHFLGHLGDDFARVEVSRHETRERGHGREEHRTYYVLEVPWTSPRLAGAPRRVYAHHVGTRRWPSSDVISPASSSSRRSAASPPRARACPRSPASSAWARAS